MSNGWTSVCPGVFYRWMGGSGNILEIKNDLDDWIRVVHVDRHGDERDNLIGPRTTAQNPLATKPLTSVHCEEP